MLAFCSRIYMSRCASLVMSYYLDINFSGLDNFLSAIPAAINIARMPARIIQSLHFWQKQAQTTIFEHFKILFKVDTQFKMANSGKRPRVIFQNFWATYACLCNNAQVDQKFNNELKPPEDYRFLRRDLFKLYQRVHRPFIPGWNSAFFSSVTMIEKCQPCYGDKDVVITQAALYSYKI